MASAKFYFFTLRTFFTISFICLLSLSVAKEFYVLFALLWNFLVTIGLEQVVQAPHDDLLKPSFIMASLEHRVLLLASIEQSWWVPEK